MAPMTEPICMNNKCNSLDKVRKYEIRLSHDLDEQIIRAQICCLVLVYKYLLATYCYQSIRLFCVLFFTIL